LTRCGAQVTVVPATTPAADVLALKPDGVFLSNGPGDPEPLDYAVKNVRALVAKKPIFWYLPGSSDYGSRVRGADVQTEIRASWRKSSCLEHRAQAGGNYRAESRFRCRP